MPSDTGIFAILSQERCLGNWPVRVIKERNSDRLPAYYLNDILSMFHEICKANIRAMVRFHKVTIHIQEFSSVIANTPSKGMKGSKNYIHKDELDAISAELLRHYKKCKYCNPPPVERANTESDDEVYDLTTDNSIVNESDSEDNEVVNDSANEDNESDSDYKSANDEIINDNESDSANENRCNNNESTNNQPNSDDELLEEPFPLRRRFKRLRHVVESDEESPAKVPRNTELIDLTFNEQLQLAIQLSTREH